jgi:hypothetical protein
MAYHSAQVHLALARLIAYDGSAASMPRVDCWTVDVQGDVAYRVTARGDARDPVARVLYCALGDKDQHAPGVSLLSVADAGKLIELAYR